MVVDSLHSGFHVAFIDSGIGGMSVLSEVKRRVPSMQVSYFMDNEFLPYGELESVFLVSRLSQIVKFLQLTKPDIVVIACNTASTQALEHLRSEFDLPFVGVVPAVKPAAQFSKNKNIGILATKATIQGQYIKTLIDSYAADCRVTSLGSSEMVACAEHYFWHGSYEKDLPDLSCFNDVDTLVLGCTHFPLIKSYLAQQLPNTVSFLDSGKAIANRVNYLLEQSSAHSTYPDLSSNSLLYCTKVLSQKQIQRLKLEGFTGVECVSIA